MLTYHFAAATLLTMAQAQPTSTKNLIMLRETGAGKSTLGNTLVGKEVFKVGDDLEACTDSVSAFDAFLFGDAEAAINMNVSDTAGLCDPRHRDDEFLDQFAAHLRSQGGTHGIIYVQDSCVRRMNACVLKSLKAIVETLTEAGKPENLNGRLAVLMTGRCTDLITQQKFENKLPDILCRNYRVCGVPLVWYEYDDFAAGDASLRSKLFSLLYHSSLDTMGSKLSSLLYTSWRKQFEGWVQRLPVDATGVPSESEREKLKREHEEELKRKEKMSRGWSNRLHSWRNSMRAYKRRRPAGKVRLSMRPENFKHPLEN